MTALQALGLAPSSSAASGESGERAPDDDWTHPLYGTWEHLQPETTEVTLAAVFVNSMKTNLTEMQFRQITVELVLSGHRQDRPSSQALSLGGPGGA